MFQWQMQNAFEVIPSIAKLNNQSVLFDQVCAELYGAKKSIRMISACLRFLRDQSYQLEVELK